MDLFGQFRTHDIAERPARASRSLEVDGRNRDRVRDRLGSGYEPGLRCLRVEQIEHCEGKVQFELGHALGRQGERFFARFRLPHASRDVAKCARTSLTDHLLGRLSHRVEQTTHAAGLVAYRTEGESEERFFEIAVTVEEHPLILEKGRLARDCAFKGLSDRGPCRGPAFGEVLAHGMRVLPTTDRPVAVVVDLHMTRSPDQRDGKVGRQAQTDGRAQALRPSFDGSECRTGPVHRPDQLAHLSAALQPIAGRLVGLSICVFVHIVGPFDAVRTDDHSNTHGIQAIRRNQPSPCGECPRSESW